MGRGQTQPVGVTAAWPLRARTDTPPDWLDALTMAAREMCAIAYLDGAHRVIGVRHIAGEQDRLSVPIRIVAADALAFDAQAAVIAHNHPSGDPSPSAADLAFTRRLARALEALGVRLIDHVVLAAQGRVSLRAAGYL